MAGRHRNLPLNPLRAFAVASRHRTFTAAAEEMGVGQVAISRQIAILESYLGVELYERGTSSAKLTEVGRAFGQEISALFDGLETAADRMLSTERQSTVKLRIYPTLACHWLLPMANRFTSKYAGYELRLDTTVEPLDFRGTHLDVAIQLGHGAWRDAKCRKLFDEVVDVVCSPAYAEKFGGFKADGSLEKAVMLHAKYRRREWDLWAAQAGFDVDFQSNMDFDSSILAYAAAKSGLGVAVGQLEILRDDLKSGALVRPFGKAVSTGMAFYVVWPTTKSVSTQTRHFIDWVLEAAGEKPEFFRKKRE